MVQNRRPQVLIVDDDQDTLEVLAANLEHCGFESVPVDSGPAALERARRGGIDVILLDIMMPGMDGLELSLHLKQDDLTCQIPVIVLTARDDSNARSRAMELGVSKFLVKPIPLAELSRTIQEQMESLATLRCNEATLKLFRSPRSR